MQRKAHVYFNMAAQEISFYAIAMIVALSDTMVWSAHWPETMRRAAINSIAMEPRTIILNGVNMLVVVTLESTCCRFRVRSGSQPRPSLIHPITTRAFETLHSSTDLVYRASFSTKKDKKKTKKGAAAEPEPIVELPPPPPPIAAPPADDDFGSFMTTKKDKKKKKNFWEADPEPVVVVPEPEPVMEESKADEDIWSPGVSSKDKKKAKKGAKAAWEEPAIVVVPDPVVEEKPDELDAWMSTSTKKVSSASSNQVLSSADNTDISDIG